MGVLLNLVLGPLNSLNELGKNDSGSLNSDDLVRVDVDLMGVAFVIDCYCVNVPGVDSISVALWSDWTAVLFVVGRFGALCVLVFSGGKCEKGGNSEGSFHLVIKV